MKSKDVKISFTVLGNENKRYYDTFELRVSILPLLFILIYIPFDSILSQTSVYFMY